MKAPYNDVAIAQPEPCDDKHENPSLIQMYDIVKTYKTSAGDFNALKNINACFYPHEFVSVVGKSGSGKSTLANMITGIDRPTSGTVRINSTDIHAMSESERSIWRGRNLGIVFQFFQLLPMLSLLENVLLPMDFCNVYAPSERERRAMELLELVGLQDYADQLPAAVSGGQQQSAAIARALANDPPIIIADEPTGNLDSRAAEAMFEVFKDLSRQGKTIVMVTHDAALAQRSDRSLLLSDGELIDEWVARAFPKFPHPRLLWLTHQLTLHAYQPGQPLPDLEAAGAGLYLVAAGRLELDLAGELGAAVSTAVLAPGEYLPAFETVLKTIKGLHAGREEPLELLALDRQAFQRWMGDSSEAKPVLEASARHWLERGLAGQALVSSREQKS
jgi:putative ABC transport system ATP-binding protein